MNGVDRCEQPGVLAGSDREQQAADQTTGDRTGRQRDAGEPALWLRP
ncbi:hypothetical protein AB0I53_33750 [Saccharopolyspora sp. NPDC050389]